MKSNTSFSGSWADLSCEFFFCSGEHSNRNYKFAVAKVHRVNGDDERVVDGILTATCIATLRLIQLEVQNESIPLLI